MVFTGHYGFKILSDPQYITELNDEVRLYLEISVEVAENERSRVTLELPINDAKEYAQVSLKDLASRPIRHFELYKEALLQGTTELLFHVLTSVKFLRGIILIDENDTARHIYPVLTATDSGMKYLWPHLLSLEPDEYEHIGVRAFAKGLLQVASYTRLQNLVCTLPDGMDVQLSIEGSSEKLG